MYACHKCSFVAKNKAGLSSHIRRHEILAMQSQEDDDEVVMPVTERAVVASEPAPLMAQPAKPAGNHAQNMDAHVCKDCHVLPTGSVELVGLLLVLVFALSAVLLTSIYFIETQL